MKLFILILFVIQNSFSSEIKNLSISGSGCQLKENLSKVEVRSDQKSNYRIKLSMQLIKNSGVGLERKACHFSLPVKLGPKEKLVVSNVSQKVKLIVNKNAQSTISLQLFVVGESLSKPYVLKTIGEGPTQTDGALHINASLESRCGKDAMLRGNLNAFAEGESRVQLDIEDLFLDLKIVTCP